MTAKVDPAVRRLQRVQRIDLDFDPVEMRAASYSMGYFSAKHLGGGQFYLMTLRDRDGRPLEGSGSYRLHVPADAPLTLYWSATAYDRETHALIRDMPRASRASNSPGLAANPDGSVDVWFAPQAPRGKEGAWTPTDPARRFEVLFRIYGPKPSFFDKTWVLPDVERIG